jgi:hypothetical protein
VELDGVTLTVPVDGAAFTVSIIVDETAFEKTARLELVNEQVIGSFPIGSPVIVAVALPLGLTVTDGEVTPEPEQLTVPVGAAPLCAVNETLTATG